MGQMLTLFSADTRLVGRRGSPHSLQTREDSAIKPLISAHQGPQLRAPDLCPLLSPSCPPSYRRVYL